MKRSCPPPRNSWLVPDRRAFSWLLTLFFLSSVLARAQPILDDYTLRHWDVEDGLPEAIVTAIDQAPDGFLWCLTPHHLARFDGVQFASIPEHQWPAQRPSEFRGLYRDNQNALWLYGNEGALRYANGAWTMVPLGKPDHTPQVKATARPTPDGPVPMSTTPILYLLSQTPAGKVLAASSLGVYQFDGHQFSLIPLTGPGLVAAGLISAAAMDANGVIWMAAGEHLLKFDQGNYVVAPLPSEVSGHQLYQVFAGGRDTLWLQQLDGRHLRRTGGQWNEVLPAGLRVSSLLETASGDTWVGAVEALFRWRNGQWDRLIGRGTEFPWDVRGLKLDRDGVLWIGAGDGLYRLQRRSVTIFPAGLPLAQQTVTALLPKASEGFWAGVPAGGLLAGVPGGFQPLPAAPMPVGTATALAQRRDGTLWIGTQGDHVWSLKADGTVLESRQRDGMRSRSVTCLLEDRAGALWVGTREGLLREAPDTWLDPVTPQPEAIFSLCEDRDGVVWAGTQGAGLWRCSGGKVQQIFRKADGLPADAVRLLLADSDGILWLGTPAGLGRWTEASRTVITVKHGLPDDDIRQMLDDGRGCLWLGSRQGITRVAKKELAEVAAGRTTPLRVRTFARDEGLTGDLCSGGQGPLSARTPDGKLWFATHAGLACVDPAQLPAEPLMPSPQTIEFRAGARLAAHLSSLAPSPGETPAAHLELPPDSRNLEFSFTTPSYTAPERVQFRTWLEGYDGSWSEARTARSVLYPHVPPGQYRFHVTASSGNGLWLEAAQAVTLTLPPVFWQTWWCITLGGALSLGLAGTVSATWMRRRGQRRLRALVREQVRERAVADERARIARDMHDNIGAGLTEIAMQSALVRRDIASGLTARAQQGIDRVCASASDLVRCVDEIVWAINPGNDTLERFINYLAQYAYHFLASADTRFRFDGPATVPAGSLPGTLRHTLFLATSEALHNAVKHAQATLIQVQVRLTDHELAITVLDNGKGFDAEAPLTPGLHEGLSSMQRRVREVGGHFRLSTQPGQGTRVEFIVPLTGAARNPPPTGNNHTHPTSTSPPITPARGRSENPESEPGSNL